MSWLLLLGPIVLICDSTELFGEAFCFALSGIALIPCAERLSYVTEQVAEHTNGTIGALLNATFGNAPEMLIATAALRSGYYRVVQLAMLGSMLTNLLFVFGMSCVVGGLRWQVQELRMTSGNVNAGLLLLAVSGSLLPAALVTSGQIQGASTKSMPSQQELQFSRINAAIMIFMYGCFLVFQLGTHKEEFEDDNNTVTIPTGKQARLGPQDVVQRGGEMYTGRNIFCLRLWGRLLRRDYQPSLSYTGDVELSNASKAYDNLDLPNGVSREFCLDDSKSSMSFESSSNSSGNKLLLPRNEPARDVTFHDHYFDDYYEENDNCSRVGRKSAAPKSLLDNEANCLLPGTTVRKKNKKDLRPMLPLGLADPSEEPPRRETAPEPQISFRVGILWLFVITIGISALSDILVDTIHGFASRLELSEVFTSVIIVPFFSNVAEQVSAILFAYRNEMDLCVGVTVGSAIQVAMFVLPGCVVIGMFVDRSMTLYFHAYETVCLFLAVIVVAAILQRGTTNWLVGLTMVGIYTMIAAGFWFHEYEDLSIDAESIRNRNTTTNV
ncbi:unnamed protein product [Cylindrotheca closterium]|uniref:Sodium/calcium exchanger membrane region domain-containing protein n=1 Tax=Cylindrotheca closterium TaxID=2856 RepID=A0AAD2FN13_9STRA|nr:unnamed protein product [Cylindrotheca closterium]